MESTFATYVGMMQGHSNQGHHWHSPNISLFSAGNSFCRQSSDSETFLSLALALAAASRCSKSAISCAKTSLSSGFVMSGGNCMWFIIFSFTVQGEKFYREVEEC